MLLTNRPLIELSRSGLSSLIIITEKGGCPRIVKPVTGVLYTAGWNVESGLLIGSGLGVQHVG